MVLFLAPTTIFFKSIRQPSQFDNPAQGCRVVVFELDNPQNSGSRIYINEINLTTRQPTLARIECKSAHPGWLYTEGPAHQAHPPDSSKFIQGGFVQKAHQ